MTTDAVPPSLVDPDLSLVLLDDEGCPHLVLSSEPAPEDRGSTVVSPGDGGAVEAPVPAGFTVAAAPIPKNAP